MEVECEELHIFCDECLKRYWDKQQKLENHTFLHCPSCKQEFGGNDPQKYCNKSRFVQKNIQKLMVRCLYAIEDKKSNDVNEGLIIDSAVTQPKKCCTWEGLWKNAENHLQNECQFIPVLCQYCNQSMVKHLIISHQTKCLSFPILCSQGCVLHIKRGEMDEHLLLYCDYRLVECSNIGCLIEQMPFLKLKEHLVSMCNYRVVKCEYHTYGCMNKELLWKDLPEHNRKYKFEHLEMRMNHEMNELRNTCNSLNKIIGQQSLV